MNTYQHIFFDLDRTLWHFDENSRNVLNQMYHQFELHPFIASPDDFISTYEIINEQLWKRYQQGRLSKEILRSERFYQTLLQYHSDDANKAAEMGDYYLTHSPLQTGLLPYTKEILAYLSNKYQLHIITNGFEEVQLIKLSNSGIIDYFQQLVFSEKVGVKKPHPLIFKRAIKNAQATFENSIMIGDDFYADIHGAEKVGMDNIYFNPNKNKHQHQVKKEIFCLSELMELL